MQRIDFHTISCRNEGCNNKLVEKWTYCFIPNGPILGWFDVIHKKSFSTGTCVNCKIAELEDKIKALESPTPDRIGRGKGAENVIMLTDENESGPPTDIDIENTKYLTGEGE